MEPPYQKPTDNPDMLYRPKARKHRKFFLYISLPMLSATLRWNLLSFRWPDEKVTVTQDPDETHNIPFCISLRLRHIFSTKKRSLSQPLKISSIPLLQSSLISEPKSRLMPCTTTDFLSMLLILHEHLMPLGAKFGCWGDLTDIVLLRFISPPQSGRNQIKKKKWG